MAYICDPLVVKPPFIWPDARIHTRGYAGMLPGWSLFAGADLISGLIVGAADKTVRWIKELLHVQSKKEISLVLVLFLAGPTRAEHLKRISTLRVARERRPVYGGTG